MLTQKKTRKRPEAATAHLDELLDEALKATFPASDPIAINVEPKSPRTRNSHNARGSRSAKTRRQGAVDAVEGDEARGPWTWKATYERSTLARCHPRCLRRQPVATRRLVCWAQPRRPPAIQGSAATRAQESAAKRPHQFARTGPQTPLCRYGHPSPAGPRQYRGRPLPAARRS